MTQMATEYFTKDHEYLRVDGDIASVGISSHAQEALGDIVFVELPEVGKTFAQGDDAAVVESVKAASDIYAPISGEVVEANGELVDNPALVNEDPQGKAWFFKLKISDNSQLDKLMDADAYAKFVAESA